MPLHFSAAHSSRIKKKPKGLHAVLKRSSSAAPFADFKRTKPKPVQRSTSQGKVADHDDFFEDCLDDRGLVATLATDPSLRDIPQNIRYIQSHMFDPVPERGGMNSTRIAEVLNFRKSLPPMVTLAHVHALIRSPTEVEREVAELTKAGALRKIVIPGRGTSGSSVSDSLVLMNDLESLLRDASGLEERVQEKFLQCLRHQPMGLRLDTQDFSTSDLTSLMRAGFLTSSSPSSNSMNVFSSPNTNTFTSLASISRAASGSIAAVGGDGAIHGAGNTGKETITTITQPPSTPHQATKPTPPTTATLQTYQLSLPNTGPYLKLLLAARSHLISLLFKTQHRELPMYLLRERWDGGVANENDAAIQAKKYRGEFTGVLPGRTRKWKLFYGLSFEWVLAECQGAGLVEVFETGSVGRGVRLV